jgi:hypothetical protein
MAVENQENGVRRAPLVFIVVACGFVVAARTKQFQAPSDHQRRSVLPRPAVCLTREINLEQSLTELRRKLFPGRKPEALHCGSP